jgi:hypothetical protein
LCDGTVVVRQALQLPALVGRAGPLHAAARTGVRALPLTGTIKCRSDRQPMRLPYNSCVRRRDRSSSSISYRCRRDTVRRTMQSVGFEHL